MATLQTVVPPIFTAIQGTNAEQFPDILYLYVNVGDVIADVTWGRGVFWKYINQDLYTVLRSDMASLPGIDVQADFRNLPYKDRSVNVVILDPPYMHGGATVKKSINDCYRNANGSHESVIALYEDGMAEAHRTLKHKGKLIIKCQDEIESGKQMLSHVELIMFLWRWHFTILDLFVLVQAGKPAIRQSKQIHARKNHSYWIIAEKRSTL